MTSKLRRLGLVYCPIVAVAIYLISDSRYEEAADGINARTAAEANTEASALTALFEAKGIDALAGYIETRIQMDADEAVLSGHYYRLEDAEGIVRVGNIAAWEEEQVVRISENALLLDHIEEVPAPSWWRFSWMVVGDSDLNYDLLVVEVALPDGGRLYVGRDTDYWNKLQFFYRVSAWALFMVTLVGLGAGVLVSRSILKTMGKINGMTGEIISTRDLGKRIPPEKEGSYFFEMVNNLNTMLDKIEESVCSIRVASNGIAHDLRTPLTRLRNRLEEIGLEERSATPKEIASLTGEVDGLLATFRSILHISQLEMGSAVLPMTRLDLSKIMKDSVDMYEPLLEEKGQQLVCEGEAVFVEGDGNLLFQLVSNLLDNARKYSPEGGRVFCSAHRDSESRPVLEIRDEGPGIPREFQEQVFDRFFRLESSRASSGVGLGLSMVSAIVRAHGASIQLKNCEPGLSVEVCFPKSKAS